MFSMCKAGTRKRRVNVPVDLIAQTRVARSAAQRIHPWIHIDQEQAAGVLLDRPLQFPHGLVRVCRERPRSRAM